VGSTFPAEVGGKLAATVVQYVKRTMEPVILSDAAADPRFAADPYVAACRPKSILCLAMVHRGRLTGILYLENNAFYDAFALARLELLQVLASQAATAVENSRLYTSVQEMTEELKRSNESLAVEVAQKTEKLRLANEQLSTELAQREVTERERASLQEEIIRAQKDRLAELSTPFIPITERIMVMPLIGEMDVERAEQVLITALKGAQSHRAEVVILDITGVTQINTSVAGSLLRAAGALRMLGAQVVLTGIRPEIAQILIALEIDFSGIVTRGTLRSGIAYALGRSRIGAV